MESADVADPQPTVGEVIVQVTLAGICGSDVTAYKGIMGISRPGAIRGHEFAGIVVGVGSPSDAEWIGRRVAVNPVVSCGTCWACTSDRDNVCTSLELIGVHRHGGFAERVAVPVRNLGEVSSEMSWESASSVEPLAQACHDVHVGLRGAAPVERALVIGAGSIGGFVVSAARLSEIPDITVVDPSPERRAAAIMAGATRAFESAEQAGEFGVALERAGYDVVFDVVGAQSTREASISLVRNAGTVVMVGLHSDRTEIPWFSLSRREVTVVGANCFTRKEFATALGWLTGGQVSVDGPAAHGTLDQGAAMFAAIAEGSAPTSKTYLLAGRESLPA